MEKVIVLFIGILIITGCATRQEKSYNYYQKNKGELAQLCNDEFPFKEEYIPGIPEVIRDTVYSLSEIEIPCPEPTPQNPKPSVKCPPQKTIVEKVFIRDTIKVESSRKTKALEFEIQNLKNEINRKNKFLEKQKKQIGQYKTIRTIGWILLLLIGAGIILKIFK